MVAWRPLEDPRAALVSETKAWLQTFDRQQCRPKARRFTQSVLCNDFLREPSSSLQIHTDSFLQSQDSEISWWMWNDPRQLQHQHEMNLIVMSAVSFCPITQINIKFICPNTTVHYWSQFGFDYIIVRSGDKLFPAYNHCNEEDVPWRARRAAKAPE